MLGTLRNVLTLISLFTVVFTKKIPRPLFEAIVMTYRYEWRVMSYALFMHQDYPPFDFRPAATDDGAEPHTMLSLTYPEHLNRWKPLYKWILAIPHYIVMVALAVAGVGAVLIGFFAVIFTGNFPLGPRDFIVNIWRYGLRVQAYVGLLTDEYPRSHFALSRQPHDSDAPFRRVGIKPPHRAPLRSSSPRSVSPT